MAKYAINDTTLTAIAEAIRAKTESSDPIDAADMAALIEGISAGGGTIITSGGTVTFDADANYYQLQHGLGKIPNFILMYTTTDGYVGTSNTTFTQGLFVLAGDFPDGIKQICCQCAAHYSNYSTALKSEYQAHAYDITTTDDIQFGNLYPLVTKADETGCLIRINYGFRGAYTYNWLVGAF